MKCIGLDIAQGTFEVTPFYWDRMDSTRAWSERFFKRAKFMPSGFPPGCIHQF